ncbi:MAG: AAA family ATPase [Holdemanella sp.]|nr:AAA family ATPase [Holdemanella sp.]
MKKSARVINLTNVSGGCGKSITAIELSVSFSTLGKKVLVVDADMQASATDSIGKKGIPLSIKELHAMDEEIDRGGQFLNILKKNLIEKSTWDLLDVLMDPECIRDVIQKTDIEGVDLLPSSIRLSQADDMLTRDRYRSPNDRISEALEYVKNDYDFIIIDNSPAQSYLSTNTMLASDINIVPVKADRKSIKGLILSIQNVMSAMRANKKELDVVVLFTMANLGKDGSVRGKYEKEIIPWFKKRFGDNVFETVIPYQKASAQSATLENKKLSYGSSRIGEAYKKLAEEIIIRLEKGEKSNG